MRTTLAPPALDSRSSVGLGEPWPPKETAEAEGHCTGGARKRPGGLQLSAPFLPGQEALREEGLGEVGGPRDARRTPRLVQLKSAI